MIAEPLLKSNLTELTRPITGEMLSKLGNIGPAELVKGEIVYMSPTGHPHGYIEINIGGILREFVRKHKLGRVIGGEVGIYTQRNPDTVRAADVAFISRGRLAQVRSQSYLDIAPELVVEVLSPDDAWSEVMEKLEEYFVVGTLSVWIADPKREQIYVYHSLTEVQRFSSGEVLADEKVLPGFSVPVAELFAAE
ncbi:MAG: Uma2 family endonuclease [Anaerolineales bacterium]|nr:Uma2 family endonuclease [Anaerolineales bacterium]